MVIVSFVILSDIYLNLIISAASQILHTLRIKMTESGIISTIAASQKHRKAQFV